MGTCAANRPLSSRVNFRTSLTGIHVWSAFFIGNHCLAFPGMYACLRSVNHCLKEKDQLHPVPVQIDILAIDRNAASILPCCLRKLPTGTRQQIPIFCQLSLWCNVRPLRFSSFSFLHTSTPTLLIFAMVNADGLQQGILSCLEA